MIGTILSTLFGGGRNIISETTGVFRENSEAKAQRQATYDQAALAQFAAEFQHERKGWFDRFIDGLNRLPRPLMALSVFALFGAAMVSPWWFAERMQGLAVVPDPLWALMGVIIAFYFGGRFQAKSQDFKKAVAVTTQVLPEIAKNIDTIRKLRHDSVGVADTGTDAALSAVTTEGAPTANKAVLDWRQTQQS